MDTRRHKAEVFCVAGDNCQSVAKRRCRNDNVGVRECVTRLASVRHNHAPFENDIFAYRQNLPLKHWPHDMGKPIL